MILRYLRKLLGWQVAAPIAFDGAFDSALEDIGEAEVPLATNSGPYVEGLRFEVDLPQKGGGEWCALFWSVHCHRVGIRIKHRGAPGIVRALGRYGRHIPRRRLKDELVDGFCGLVLHKRGTTGHHVRGIRVFAAESGELLVRYIGGNERHRVKSGVVPLRKFLPTVLKASTV